jgi:hypothetical protein
VPIIYCIETDAQTASVAFTYHPDADTYTCPLGKTLVVTQRQKKAGYTIYTCAHCRDCPHKLECSPKAVGRSICRHKDEVSMQRMRDRMDSAEGKKLYGKRFARVEPVFVQTKSVMGFRRFRLRGTTGALKEFLLLCIAHNLRRLARHMRSITRAGAHRAETGKIASALSVLIDQLGAIIALMLQIHPKQSLFALKNHNYGIVSWPLLAQEILHHPIDAFAS